MHRFPRSLLGLGVLTLAACGAPAELDENRFPGPDQTGYTDGPTGNPPVGNGGTSNVGAGGSQLPSGGASGPGVGGTTLNAGGSGAPANPAPASSCPDDITVLFNRPVNQGGCATPGCHVPGGSPPDLVSPGLEGRLLNVMSTSSCGQRPYISSGESLLGLKLVPPVPCGLPMPFGGQMTDEELQCVLDWIAEVSGG